MIDPKIIKFMESIGDLMLQRQALDKKVNEQQELLSIQVKALGANVLEMGDCEACDGTGESEHGTCLSCDGEGSRYYFVIRGRKYNCKIYEVTQLNASPKKGRKLLSKSLFDQLFVPNSYDRVDIRPTSEAKLAIVFNG